MVFQWIMGYFIYKALHAEGSERKKLFRLAYGVPFVFHGLWDFCLDLTGFVMDMESIAMQLLGGGLMVGMMAAMPVISIVIARKISKKLTDNI